MNMNIDDAQVTIPLKQLDALRAYRAQLEGEIAALRNQIEELKTSPPGAEDLARRAATSEAVLAVALDLIGVFIGKCSSYEVAGWPFEKLRMLCGLLDAAHLLPDSAADLLVDWRQIADQAEAHEAARAAKRKPVREATAEDWASGRRAFEREFGFAPSGQAYMSGELQQRVQAPRVSDDGTGKHPADCTCIDCERFRGEHGS